MGETEHLQAQALADLGSVFSEKLTFTKRFLLFCGSLFLFVLLGIVVVQISKTLALIDLALILLVLFVHELGHYLSMRWLAYKDVHMFFVPLFGAAVSGYPANIPIVQQAFVAMAGPIPGIFIGSVCLVIFSVNGVEIWQKLATMFIVVNGLNLFPLQPLDGGQFVDYVVPNHCVKLKTLLQLVGIGLGAYLSYELGTILFNLSIYTLIHLGRNYKINTLIHKHNICNLQSEHGLSYTMPLETAKLIIADITERLPNLDSTREIARCAWNIWNRATSKRPNKLEALVMVVVYLAGLTILFVYQFVYLKALK